MSDIYTGIQFEKIADILLVQTRMEFLLLTMSPERVRDQLVKEFGNMENMFGQPTNAARIVEQPR